MLRFLKPNLGMTLFGAPVLFAFFASALVLADEAHHESAPPTVATAANEESFLKENDADAWELLLNWLLELRRRRIAVIIVHHAGAAGQRMRGTTKRE